MLRAVPNAWLCLKRQSSTLCFCAHPSRFPQVHVWGLPPSLWELRTTAALAMTSKVLLYSAYVWGGLSKYVYASFLINYCFLSDNDECPLDDTSGVLPLILEDTSTLDSAPLR